MHSHYYDILHDFYGRNRLPYEGDWLEREKFQITGLNKGMRVTLYPTKPLLLQYF